MLQHMSVLRRIELTMSGNLIPPSSVLLVRDELHIPRIRPRLVFACTYSGRPTFFIVMIIIVK